MIYVDTHVEKHIEHEKERLTKGQDSHLSNNLWLKAVHSLAQAE